VSPYFQVVKPTLAGGFDHRLLRWRDDEAPAAQLAAAGQLLGKSAA
jgi:hypothetical protein